MLMSVLNMLMCILKSQPPITPFAYHDPSAPPCFCTMIKVATGQIASTGMVALGYVQKVSEKVSLASDFMYNSCQEMSLPVLAIIYFVSFSINIWRCFLKDKFL